MSNATLIIENKEFDKRRKEVTDKWDKEWVSEGEPKGLTASFECEFRPEEISYDDGELTVYGVFDIGELGSVSISFPIPTHVSQSILEDVVKKYNKVKTLMEAVK